MGNYDKTFEWLDFPEGRVRYGGGRRGKEDPPIQTFATDIGERIYYGEIEKRFLSDRNSFNLEVVSFGWTDHEWVGTEPNPSYCSAFTLEALMNVRSLISKAVPIWRGLEDRPTFLTEYFTSAFMGEIVFRDGWALLQDDPAEEHEY